MNESSSPKARGRSFEKGRSGNPAGRPRGARNRTTLAAEALLLGQAEALTQKALERALEGDPVALRLCLERVLPARRERLISFEMPSLESAEDAAPAMAAIVAAVAAGDITLSEAAQLGKLVETFVRAIEARDQDKHLKLLEWQQSNWQAKFEPLGLDEDLPEELPPFTPRIRAMREQWWRMPIKDHIRMLRGAREGRWDDVPELYDPRTMTPTELR